MNLRLLKRVITSGQRAQECLSAMSKTTKAKLEKTWDVEHAYYSSALEGSKLSRKAFNELAQRIS
jgi:hypothetical protein